ncbi:hypothetical protein BDW22DRAFT_1349541, partial [Trametopsis cervina]
CFQMETAIDVAQEQYENAFLRLRYSRQEYCYRYAQLEVLYNHVNVPSDLRLPRPSIAEGVTYSSIPPAVLFSSLPIGKRSTLTRIMLIEELVEGWRNRTLDSTTDVRLKIAKLEALKREIHETYFRYASGANHHVWRDQ